MRAGALNRRISIRKPTTAGRSTDGEPLYTWTTIINDVWADRQPYSGKEMFAQDVRWSNITRHYYLRYVSTLATALDATCRLIDFDDSSSEWDIRAVIDVKDANRTWELLTEKST